VAREAKIVTRTSSSRNPERAAVCMMDIRAVRRAAGASARSDGSRGARASGPGQGKNSVSERETPKDRKIRAMARTVRHRPPAGGAFLL
jgi:hypothetical protein